MAVRLLFRYGQHAFLLEPLSRLAREELRHFEEVLRLLEARGVAFRILRPSPYAGLLRRAIRTSEPARLVDTLLCSALIEARSCERFGLLADRVADPGLSAFYRGLLAAEARHRRVYVGLAERIAPVAEVRRRLADLARHEAAALDETPPMARLHA